jgi:hypothetical protein
MCVYSASTSVRRHEVNNKLMEWTKVGLPRNSIEVRRLETLTPTPQP